MHLGPYIVQRLYISFRSKSDSFSLTAFTIANRSCCCIFNFQNTLGKYRTACKCMHACSAIITLHAFARIVLRKVMSKRQRSILQFVSNPKRFVPIYTPMNSFVIASFRGSFSSDHDVNHHESSATSSANTSN